MKNELREIEVGTGEFGLEDLLMLSDHYIYNPGQSETPYGISPHSGAILTREFGTKYFTHRIEGHIDLDDDNHMKGIVIFAKLQGATGRIVALNEEGVLALGPRYHSIERCEKTKTFMGRLGSSQYILNERGFPVTNEPETRPDPNSPQNIAIRSMVKRVRKINDPNAPEHTTTYEALIEWDRDVRNNVKLFGLNREIEREVSANEVRYLAERLLTDHNDPKLPVELNKDELDYVKSIIRDYNESSAYLKGKLE